MARVTLASSLTLVSLRLRSSATRYRKEENFARGKDASLFARTLLHHQRTAAMADDECATLPHRIREREVNLPQIQWRSLYKRLSHKGTHRQSSASDFVDFWICYSLLKNKRHVFFFCGKNYLGVKTTLKNHPQKQFTEDIFDRNRNFLKIQNGIRSSHIKSLKKSKIYFIIFRKMFLGVTFEGGFHP